MMDLCKGAQEKIDLPAKKNKPKKQKGILPKVNDCLPTDIALSEKLSNFYIQLTEP